MLPLPSGTMMNQHLRGLQHRHVVSARTAAPAVADNGSSATRDPPKAHLSNNRAAFASSASAPFAMTMQREAAVAANVNEPWDPFSVSSPGAARSGCPGARERRPPSSPFDSIFDDDGWDVSGNGFGDGFGTPISPGDMPSGTVDPFGDEDCGETSASWSSFRNMNLASSKAEVKVVQWPSPSPSPTGGRRIAEAPGWEWEGEATGGAARTSSIASAAAAAPVAAEREPGRGDAAVSSKVTRAREIIRERQQRRQEHQAAVDDPPWKDGRGVRAPFSPVRPGGAGRDKSEKVLDPASSTEQPAKTNLFPSKEQPAIDQKRLGSVFFSGRKQSSSGRPRSRAVEPLEPPLSAAVAPADATPEKNHGRKEATHQPTRAIDAPGDSTTTAPRRRGGSDPEPTKAPDAPLDPAPAAPLKKFQSFDSWKSRLQQRQRQWDDATANSVLTDELMEDQRRGKHPSLGRGRESGHHQQPQQQQRPAIPSTVPIVSVFPNPNLPDSGRHALRRARQARRVLDGGRSLARTLSLVERADEGDAGVAADIAPCAAAGGAKGNGGQCSPCDISQVSPGDGGLGARLGLSSGNGKADPFEAVGEPNTDSDVSRSDRVADGVAASDSVRTAGADTRAVSNKPPLSPSKLMASRNSVDRNSSVKSRRLLWGGELLQPKVAAEEKDEENKLEVDTHETDPDKMVFDSKREETTKERQQRSHYEEDGELQKATRKSSPGTDASSPRPSVCEDADDGACRSKQVLLRWPPPHPSSRPAALTPEGSSNASRMTIDHFDLSPTDTILKQQSSPQLKKRAAGVMEQSPTRSDHSADAAAGAKSQRRARPDVRRMHEVRRRIFGPLGGTNNDRGSECQCEEGLDVVHPGGKMLPMRDVVRDDAGIEEGAEKIHSNDRHLSSSNALKSSKPKIERKVLWEYQSAEANTDGAVSGKAGTDVPPTHTSADEGVRKSASDVGPQHSNIDLEAKLNKLARIHRSKTFDNSAASLGKSSVVSGRMSASGASAQPSVESECVRQNAQIALEMDLAMMDFFTANGREEAEAVDVEADASCRSDERDIGCAPQDPKHKYTSLNQLDQDAKTPVRANSTRQQQLRNVVGPAVGANKVSPSQGSRPSAFLLPSPSEEYEDPSVFGNSILSLISGSSSDLTPALGPAGAAAKATDQANFKDARDKMRPQVSSSNLTRDRLGTGAVVTKRKNTKDLTQFLDQFSDNVLLRGCRDGDGDSSDVFFLPDSQFGGNSRHSNRSGFASPSPAEGTILLNRAMNTEENSLDEVNSMEEVLPLKEALSLNKVGTLAKASPLEENDSQDEDSIFSGDPVEDPRKQKQQWPRPTPLPPVSTFLSAKERARIRQHDTTPLRANTSRARRMRMPILSFSFGEEASMFSIKEDDNESDTSTSEQKRAPQKSDAVISGEDKSEDASLGRRSRQGEDGNLNFSVDPPEDLVKMTYREKWKGSSFHWHSSNGVNEDELYDSKLLPPSRANNVRARLNLFSISSSHTATLRQHFGDSRQRGVSSLYRGMEGIEDDEDQRHDLSLIQEESGDESSDIEEGVNDCDDEYTHDHFVRDFKDIMAEENQASEAHMEANGESNSLEEILADGSKDMGFNNAYPCSGQTKRGLSPAPSLKSTAQPIRFEMMRDCPPSTGEQRKASCRYYKNPNCADQHSQVHHPHHVPLGDEPARSRLEEKLRGIGGAKTRDCGNSVGTSDLGSIVTKDSDRSHMIGLPVPTTIFHRTHPNLAETDSARSSPSSMQNTYNASAGGVPPVPKCAENKDQESICQALSEEFTTQVKLLLPDDDDDEPALACPSGAHDMATGTQMALQCPSSSSLTFKRSNKESNTDHLKDIISKIDGELRRNKLNNHKQRSYPPLSSQEKLPSNNYHAEGSSIGGSASRVTCSTPNQLANNSKVRPRKFWLGSSDASHQIKNGNLKVSGKDSIVGKNIARFNASSVTHMTSSKGSQAHTGEKLKKSLSSRSVDKSHRINNAAQQRMKIQPGVKDGHAASQHFPQPEINFKRKMGNSRSLNKTTDDTSQHSSIFEAYEVTPLRSIATGESSPGEMSVSLDDFGVHHALVERGVTKKKVGFPETVREKAVANSGGRDARQRNTKNRHANMFWSSTVTAIPMEKNEASSQNEFEVMLQSRSKNRKLPPPHSATSKKQPKVQLGFEVKLRPRDLNKNYVQTVVQPPAIKKRPNIGGQQQVSNSISLHHEKIKQRLRSGWKKIVAAPTKAKSTNRLP